MRVAIFDPDQIKLANDELPTLSDFEMLAEMSEVLGACHPMMVIPSSARMRRILRTAIKLMEEKLPPKKGFDVRVRKEFALVGFKRNEHIQRAFEELEKHIPTRWAERGRMKFLLCPIDMSYGSPSDGGFISVNWGIDVPHLEDKTDKTGQCTVIEALKGMISSKLTAMELACPVGAERVNVELKIIGRKPL